MSINRSNINLQVTRGNKMNEDKELKNKIDAMRGNLSE